MLSPQELIDFETDICNSFANKEIKAPIHLYSNNEKQIIEIFKNHVKPIDWVISSWRSHYQILLHGVPKEKVKQAILDGRSIALCFPEHRVYSSAIVGGNIPIAVGIAMGIKANKGINKVVCMVGDMTSCNGIFMEALEYSANHELPVLFVIEDNNKSVCTPTRKTWGTSILPWEILSKIPKYSKYLTGYYYESKYPHAGGLSRVQF